MKRYCVVVAIQASGGMFWARSSSSLLATTWYFGAKEIERQVLKVDFLNLSPFDLQIRWLSWMTKLIRWDQYGSKFLNFEWVMLTGLNGVFRFSQYFYTHVYHSMYILLLFYYWFDVFSYGFDALRQDWFEGDIFLVFCKEYLLQASNPGGTNCTAHGRQIDIVVAHFLLKIYFSNTTKALQQRDFHLQQWWARPLSWVKRKYIKVHSNPEGRVL